MATSVLAFYISSTAFSSKALETGQGQLVVMTTVSGNVGCSLPDIGKAAGDYLIIINFNSFSHLGTPYAVL